MARTIIVTGAAGHLGRHIVQLLRRQGEAVRALALPGEDASMLEEAGAAVYRGDVCSPEQLAPLFAGLRKGEAVVIHAAGIIDIGAAVSPKTRLVNVGGTRNMIECALAAGARRFLYVSSVHAIPEAPGHRCIRETKHFSPDTVRGGYAKTKAEASALVMEAVEKRGLDGILLHPSGIIGPMDSGSNHIVAALRAYLEGKLPACPKGGYDLVDVRDVAAACVAAIDRGRVGEGYILSGRHYEMREIFRITRELVGRGGRCPAIPVWLARAAAPFLQWQAKRKKKRPLVTPYSLDTLNSNDHFSHEKASRELGFWPRDICDTLADTAAWLLRDKKPPRRRRLAPAGSRA